MCLYPLGPPRYINFFEPFHFLAGDQLVVPIAASHISIRLQEIQSREWEERKQTNKPNNMPGVNSKCNGKELCDTAFPVFLCRLTLAWISSETSTKLLRMPTYPDRSSSLLWTSLACQLVSLLSGVDSPLVSPFTKLPSSSSFVQLPSRVPLPTSGHAEISSPKLFVWFRVQNRQRNRLLGGPPT